MIAYVTGIITFRFMPALPSPRPQPGSVGAHPGQRSPSVPQPHPFSGQPEAGPSHQGARFPGAPGAVGKLPKVPREALVLPHLKPATAARQVPMGRGWRSPRAERGRRDSTRLCWASALGPSRAGWARGPAPAPSRVAPPRPAPPLRGTLQSAPRELGLVEAVTPPPLAPSTSTSPGASPPTPRAAALRRVPNTRMQRGRTRPFRGSSDCLVQSLGRLSGGGGLCAGTRGLSRCRPERPSLPTQGEAPEEKGLEKEALNAIVSRSSCTPNSEEPREGIRI